jgi:hypothetical protein
MIVRMGAVGSLLLLAGCAGFGKGEASGCEPARGMGVHGVTRTCQSDASDATSCGDCTERLR